MIPWSRKVLAASFVTVAIISGILSVAGLAPRPGPAGPPHWLTFSDPTLEGEPEQNTTQIWRAVIRDVSSEEPLSRYQVSLLQNGEVIVEPLPLRSGTLDQRGELWFEFFDQRQTCSPCPPPEGWADGLLGAEDYFRLSGVETGTTYVIQVSWAETREVAGEIEVKP